MPFFNAMARLVPEHVAEPIDYPGRADDRKLLVRKGEGLADFRWVNPIRGVESRTQILTHGWVVGRYPSGEGRHARTPDTASNSKNVAARYNPTGKETRLK